MHSCKIYYSYYIDRLSQSQLDELIFSLPFVMQGKAFAYRRWEDAHAYVLGRTLLRHALDGSDYKLTDIKYSTRGRPYIHGVGDFNITHSGNLVACSLTTHGRIGIDIEMHQPLKMTDFTPQFTAAEWHYIHQHAAPTTSFYDHWTAKEAILKADGRGLIDDLSSLEVSNFNQVILDNITWYLHRIDQFPGYSCQVATDHPNQQYSFIPVKFPL
ncbi:4'-phosphopantetheinyl transferase family protein [Chitinophaga sp. LS1]|uniref:4'-phosphopantetheinyl transferase family protein n=1 Tax=Chitinophaga sp. LS1 TaxID=3051176 RepID=UPI002AAC4539|nr:4'-phosphopantetheinyl transferase superfamily protein [Chitinophaga sp. LS1]WPV66522.1 4'-phosphopantetheinyl transferase superfamily protein [Chitinophaga sp. LS1]